MSAGPLRKSPATLPSPRVLWHGGVPWSRKSTGIQTALFAELLTSAGYSVALSAIGHEHGVRDWKGLPVYPVVGDPRSALANAMANLLGEDERPSCAVVLAEESYLSPPDRPDRSAGYWVFSEFDRHQDATIGLLDQLQTPTAVPTQHAWEQLTAAGIDTRLVPFGVDVGVFTPMEDRSVARRRLGVGNSEFLVGMVSANAEAAFNRKALAENIRGFELFARSCSDARLYLHTDLAGAVGAGIDLYRLLETTQGLEGRVLVADEWSYRTGLSREALARLYCAFDVLLFASGGESFGLPAIEAQACGTPVIVSNIPNQVETVGAGWTVEGQTRYAWWADRWLFTPSEESIAQALEAAYGAADIRELRRKARRSALAFDHRRVARDHLLPWVSELVGET